MKLEKPDGPTMSGMAPTIAGQSASAPPPMPVTAVAIVQARMNSTRLPGKVLRRQNGKPMLSYLLERLQRCRTLGRIVVATSVEPADDPIAALAHSHGVASVRGPLDDVAVRVALALRTHPATAAVRISGDSPLIDPNLVDRLVERFRADPTVDLVTNVFPRSFPPGQSVEVMRGACFLSALDAFEAGDEREHVTLHFYRHPDRYRIVNVSAPRQYPPLRLAVDTEEDWSAFAGCVAAMTAPVWSYDLDAVVSLWPPATNAED